MPEYEEQQLLKLLPAYAQAGASSTKNGIVCGRVISKGHWCVFQTHDAQEMAKNLRLSREGKAVCAAQTAARPKIHDSPKPMNVHHAQGKKRRNC